MSAAGGLREPSYGPRFREAPLSSRAKWVIGLAMALVVLVFLQRIADILYPFLWSILAAYLLTPIVNYLDRRLLLPRFLAVLLLYFVFLCALIVASRYLYPLFTTQISIFTEDLPKLQGSLIHLVGPTPLGINIDQLAAQVETNLTNLTGTPKAAEKVVASAANTAIRIFIFLVSTFYLLRDGPRIRVELERLLPMRYRGELLRLAARIHATWMAYIRGELFLFAIMATVSGIGLGLLQVPGFVPLAIATGALELLPIVGPITAGALAVSVAYLSGSNPFGWSQLTYAIVVAAMYFILRESEDYFVMPKVIGRAVRLHPLAVIFALAAGGLVAGFFGLLIAVPVAASLKIVAAYLFDKLMDDGPRFPDIHQAQLVD